MSLTVLSALVTQQVNAGLIASNGQGWSVAIGPGNDIHTYKRKHVYPLV